MSQVLGPRCLGVPQQALEGSMGHCKMAGLSADTAEIAPVAQSQARVPNGRWWDRAARVLVLVIDPVGAHGEFQAVQEAEEGQGGSSWRLGSVGFDSVFWNLNGTLGLLCCKARSWVFIILPQIETF